ncbi:sensor histidine kinase [Pilimelia terevasa]|uniref:sensor histidine kinase n=1 Tax=Pilimelia terevasa TaxID=53372 RepID=UPI001E452141|nr:ATP-binding protein [Pilimelia terevasa]
MREVAASGAALRRTPLRVKLVAAVLALMFAALVVTSFGGVLALRAYLFGEVDRELADTARLVPQYVLEGSPGGLPSDYVLAFVSRNGEAERNEDGTTFHSTRLMSAEELPQLPRNREEMLRRLGRPWTEQARSGPRRWRVLALPQDRGDNGRVTLVARDLTEVDRAVGRLVWIDVLVGGGMLILLASLGAALVRTSLRPLVEIEQTAGAIAAGDLSRRVPDPEPGVAEPTSELGRLSRALNAMLAQIESAFTARAESERAARVAETGARAAEAVARESEARALRSEDKMRQFVADASHELRTPLTTIRGFAELYRQAVGADAAEAARLVRRIEDEAARMGLLVEDLLLLARLDRQRPLGQAPVTLAVLAGDAVQAARVTAPDRRITLDLAPGSAGLTVRGDDARLRQVLGNLVTNALVHTPPAAQVTVRLRDGGDGTAVLEVADTGPGLPADQAERVFERFYRADAARSRHAGEVTGTGLGLAIVAAIVAAHAGAVEVESAPGVGATFRVRLPRLPDNAE